MLQLSVRWVKRFHSLQTGRWIASKLEIARSEMGNNSFHSLQTGRWIASKYCGSRWCRYQKFPFPSNGKVDRKNIQQVELTKQEGSCFHSLQTGRWIASLAHCRRKPKMDRKFPFPSNGKVDRKSYPITRFSEDLKQVEGFHSLQTGRWIARETGHLTTEKGRSTFPFPSNGKVDRKSNA